MAPSPGCSQPGAGGNAQQAEGAAEGRTAFVVCVDAPRCAPDLADPYLQRDALRLAAVLSRAQYRVHLFLNGAACGSQLRQGLRRLVADAPPGGALFIVALGIAAVNKAGRPCLVVHDTRPSDPVTALPLDDIAAALSASSCTCRGGFVLGVPVGLPAAAGARAARRRAAMPGAPCFAPQGFRAVLLPGSCSLSSLPAGPSPWVLGHALLMAMVGRGGGGGRGGPVTLRAIQAALRAVAGGGAGPAAAEPPAPDVSIIPSAPGLEYLSDTAAVPFEVTVALVPPARSPGDVPPLRPTAAAKAELAELALRRLIGAAGGISVGAAPDSPRGPAGREEFLVCFATGSALAAAEAEAAVSGLLAADPSISVVRLWAAPDPAPALVLWIAAAVGTTQVIEAAELPYLAGGPYTITTLSGTVDGAEILYAAEAEVRRLWPPAPPQPSPPASQAWRAAVLSLGRGSLSLRELGVGAGPVTPPQQPQQQLPHLASVRSSEQTSASHAGRPRSASSPRRERVTFDLAKSGLPPRDKGTDREISSENRGRPGKSQGKVQQGRDSGLKSSFADVSSGELPQPDDWTPVASDAEAETPSLTTSGRLQERRARLGKVSIDVGVVADGSKGRRPAARVSPKESSQKQQLPSPTGGERARHPTSPGSPAPAQPQGLLPTAPTTGPFRPQWVAPSLQDSKNPDRIPRLDSLKVGDHIALLASAPSGLLSVEWAADELRPVLERDFGGGRVPRCYERCVFQIESILGADQSGGGKAKPDEGRAAARPVTYGMQVRLFNVTSRRYLSTVGFDDTAAATSQLRLALTTKDTALAGTAFKFQPFTQMRVEQDHVRLGDRVLLLSMLGNQMLSVGRQLRNATFSPGKPVLSAGLVPAPKSMRRDGRLTSPGGALWTLAPYYTQQHQGGGHGGAPSDLLQTGTAVLIFHKEFEGFLTADVSLSAHQMPSTQPVQFSADTLTDIAAAAGGARQDLGESCAVYFDMHTSQQQKTSQTYVCSDLPHSSNAVWVVEAADPTRGGPVVWAHLRRVYRFRHVATGGYLIARPEDDDEDEWRKDFARGGSLPRGGSSLGASGLASGRDSPTAPDSPRSPRESPLGEGSRERYACGITDDPSDPNTLVMFYPVNNVTGSTEEHGIVVTASYCRVQFFRSRQWLHIGPERPAAQTQDGPWRGRGRPSSNVSKVQHPLLSAEPLYDAVFAIRPAPEEEVERLTAVSSMRNVLSGCICHWLAHPETLQECDGVAATPRPGTSRPRKPGSSEARRRPLARLTATITREGSTALAVFESTADVLTNLIWFCSKTAGEVRADAAGRDADWNPFVFHSPHKVRQQILFAQSVHLWVVKLLQVPFTVGDLDAERLTNMRLVHILRLGYRLLKQMARGQPALAAKLADFVPFFVSHLPYQFQAIDTLVQIYKDNRELLMRLTRAELEAYLKPTPFLELLACACICSDGEDGAGAAVGIARNQKLISDLLEEHKGIGVVFPTRAHRGTLWIKPVGDWESAPAGALTTRLAQSGRQEASVLSGLACTLDGTCSGSARSDDGSCWSDQDDDMSAYLELTERENADWTDADTDSTESMPPPPVETPRGRREPPRTPPPAHAPRRAGRNSESPSSGSTQRRVRIGVAQLFSPPVSPRRRRRKTRARRRRDDARKVEGWVTLRDFVREQDVEYIKHFEKTLLLWARLCAHCPDRDPTVVERVLTHVTPKEVLVGMAVDLHDPMCDAIRTAYATLARCIFIHRKSRHAPDLYIPEELRPAHRKRLEMVLSALGADRPVSQYDGFLRTLKRIVKITLKRNYFQVAECLSRNIFLTEIILLMQEMLLHNLYAPSELRELLPHLLTLLDGASDVATMSQAGPLAPHVAPAADGGAQGFARMPSLWLMAEERKNQPQASSLSRMSPRAAASQSGDPVSMGRSQFPSLRSPREDRSGAFGGSHVARFEYNEMTRLVMDTKVELCKLLVMLMDRDGEETPGGEVHDFAAWVAACQIRHEGGAKLLTRVLLETSLYENYPPLFKGSLVALYRSFCCLSAPRSTRGRERPAFYADIAQVEACAVDAVAAIITDHLEHPRWRGVGSATESELDTTVPFQVVTNLFRHFRDQPKGDRLSIALLRSFTRVLTPPEDSRGGLSREVTQRLLDWLEITPYISVLIESPDEEVVKYALECGIALLEGGNKAVQTSLFAYFRDREDELLFMSLMNRIRQAIDFVNEEEGGLMKQRTSVLVHAGKGKERNKLRNNLAGLRVQDSGRECSGFSYAQQTRRVALENERERLRTETREAEEAKAELYKSRNLFHVREVMRYLQLFCEGHNAELQNYLREQPDNLHSFNLVDESLSFLQAVLGVSMIDSFIGEIILQTFNTLTEYCQGPVAPNQQCAVRGGVCSLVNKVLQAPEIGGLDFSNCGSCPDEGTELAENIRAAAVTLTLALLEGVTDRSIPETMVGRLNHGGLDLDVLHSRLIHAWGQREDLAASDAALENGFSIFILFKTLQGYFPSPGESSTFDQYISTSADNPDAECIRFFAARTGRIEICRGSDLERVYFRIPDVCLDGISEKTKNELLWRVRRDTPTTRILDFFDKGEELMFEVEYNEEHFQEASLWGVLLALRNRADVRRAARSWVRKNAHAMERVLVWVALLINALILVSDVSRSRPAPAQCERHPAAAGLPLARLAWCWSWFWFWTVARTGAMEWLINGLAVAQIALYVTAGSDFVVSEAPILAFRRWKAKQTRASATPHRADDSVQQAQFAQRTTLLLQQLAQQEKFERQGSPVADPKSVRLGASMSVRNPSAGGTPRQESAAMAAAAAAACRPTARDRCRRLCGRVHCGALTRAARLLHTAPPDPRKKHSLAVAQTCLLSPIFYYQCAMILFGVLGIAHHPLWLSIHCLGIVRSSHSLHNVIKAVTQNGRALVLTALLGIIVVYLFSVGTYVFFADSMVHKSASMGEEHVCASLAGCFAYSLTHGVRSGGGIGDLMDDPHLHSPQYSFQMLWEVVFWVVVVVFLLNIVFGIIVDTFAELRAHKELVEEDIRNKCFICGLDASEFERHAMGFQHHISDDHNLWNYVFFLHYLRMKDQSEYTGQESYVADSVRRMDLSFFPLNKAMVLDNSFLAEDGEAAGGETGDVIRRMDAVEERLGDELAGTTKELQDARAQLNEVARQLRDVLQMQHLQQQQQQQRRQSEHSPSTQSPTNGQQMQQQQSGDGAGARRQPRLPAPMQLSAPDGGLGQSFAMPSMLSGLSFNLPGGGMAFGRPYP